MLDYIDIAQQRGCRQRCSAAGAPTRPECGEGWFVEPTIFTGVDNSMRIAQEEVFGPVLAVIPFTDEDDAVRIANDSRFGLGAGCVDLATSGVRSGCPSGSSRARCG